MKLTGKQIDRFLAAPDAGQRAALLYGPDAGLRRERIAQLRGIVVDDPNDPFRVSELTGAQINADPARLADEAAALTFGGGRRFVAVREAADSITAIVKDFLEHAPGEAFVVFDGGDLPGRSSLRRLFEGAKAAAAVPCYHDDARSLPAVVRAFFADAGLGVDREAVDFLAAHLGGDPAARLQRAPHGTAVRRRLDGKSLGGQEARQKSTDARVVVHDQNALRLNGLVHVGPQELEWLTVRTQHREYSSARSRSLRAN